jgi:glycosyltransferase involved in cell wall biosynthesis
LPGNDVPSVLHICRRFYPQSNGSEIYTGTLIPLLAEGGVRNRILAAGSPEESYFWREFPVTRADDSTVLLTTGRTRFLEQFVALLDAHKPDLVHWHFLPVDAEPMLEASIRRGIRNIHTLHHAVTLCARHDFIRMGEEMCLRDPSAEDCGPCMIHFLGMPRPLAKAYSVISQIVPTAIKRSLPPSKLKTSLTLTKDIGTWVDTQQRSLARFDQHVVLSQASADALTRSGVERQKIFVSRLGTRHIAPTKNHWTSWRHPEKPVRMIFVGRLDTVKGVTTLIDAADRFSNTELQLDVYGVPGDAEAPMLRLIQRPGCPIRFCGFLPLDDVVNRMAEYDFVVIPSQSFETGPFTAVEALQAGTPIIASDIASLNEFIDHGKTGWLVKPGSAAAWVVALRAAIDQPDVAARMREQLSFPRSMGDVASEMISLYFRMLSIASEVSL